MNYADELKSGMRWQRERAEELKKNLETQTTIDEKGIFPPWVISPWQALCLPTS